MRRSWRLGIELGSPRFSRVLASHGKVNKKRARRKYLTSPGSTRKEEIHPTDTACTTKNRYRRPPPPCDPPPPPRDPPPLGAEPRLGAELLRGALLEEEVRLCTTDGLMRTALPVDRAAFALPAGTPLLLPLNRCQPPVLPEGACAADPVAAAARLTLGAVLPVEVVAGVLRGKPALGPPDPEGPLLLNVCVPAPLEGLAVERVIAWRCWSNDT